MRKETGAVLAGLVAVLVVATPGALAATVVRAAVLADTSPPLRSLHPALRPAAMPDPIVSFDGIGQDVPSSGQPIPPDTVGAIGPDHFVQAVNNRFAVYRKDGGLLFGPVPTNTLFAGFGELCEVTNVGDPVVLHDQLADRWIVSQFGFLRDPVTRLPSGPFYQCVAVSVTPDPTGAYHRYAFEISKVKMNDYPKLGVWPDAYYLSVNQFVPTGTGLRWGGAAVAAFERERMLAGDPGARLVVVDVASRNPLLGGMLPADLDGSRPPPAGSPGWFAEVDDDAWGFPDDQLTLFAFRVDWDDPDAATFTTRAVLATEPFDSNLCGYRDCVPQPGTFQRLDTLSDRLMFRLAYRNLGTHEALVVNHTVDVDGTDHAGIRWYEVRDPLARPVIYQQGTFAPDAEHRWMGSIAMDGNGNIALGYSASSAAAPPSIRYAGRLAGDPLGELPQRETVLSSGAGAQTHRSGRWGDYSALTVDPVDDCTFWYTQEYYATTSQRGWKTRIGAFSFPSCDATPPTATIRPAKARAGGSFPARYRLADGSGEAAATVRVRRLDGRAVRTATAPLGPAMGAPARLTVQAPTTPGKYAVCVVAADTAGNESAEACARLTVRPRAR